MQEDKVRCILLLCNLVQLAACDTDEQDVATALVSESECRGRDGRDSKKIESDYRLSYSD